MWPKSIPQEVLCSEPSKAGIAGVEAEEIVRPKVTGEIAFTGGRIGGSALKADVPIATKTRNLPIKFKTLARIRYLLVAINRFC